MAVRFFSFKLLAFFVTILIRTLKFLILILYRIIGNPVPLEMEDILARITKFPRALVDGDVPVSDSELAEQLKKLITVLNSIPANQLNPQLLDVSSRP